MTTESITEVLLEYKRARALEARKNGDGCIEYNPLSQCPRFTHAEVGLAIGASIDDDAQSSAIFQLFDSIKIVLGSAIDSISMAAPDAINGEHRDFLNVHNPNRSHSPTGFCIRQEEVSSKNTYFTDEQIIY